MAQGTFSFVQQSMTAMVDDCSTIAQHALCFIRFCF